MDDKTTQYYVIKGMKFGHGYIDNILHYYTVIISLYKNYNNKIPTDDIFVGLT